MPFIDANGMRLHYIEAGSGPETIVFSHGFLMNHHMFDHQIKVLSDTYRVIAYDHRCHGQSATCHDPFGLGDLVDDAAALIRALCDGPVHFAGMSTGGFVGMRLALRAPELIKTLTLIDTAAAAEDPVKLKQYNQLLFAVRWIGARPLLGKVMPILMAQTFLNDPARQNEVMAWRQHLSDLDKKSIYRFGKAIFTRDSVLDALAALDQPPRTQIIVGAEDIATPVAASRATQSVIKGAELDIIPKAGHSSPLEMPQQVTDVISRFLTAQTAQTAQTSP